MSIQNVTNEQLIQLMADTPDLQLVDVRTPEEYWFLGHIPGATLLPIQQIMERWTELDLVKPTAVVCEHGVRSINSCYFLAEKGFETLYNLTDGMAEWTGPREISPVEVPPEMV